MNYKNLNYEIETDRKHYQPANTGCNCPTMNYKNLNYEIETEIHHGIVYTFPMNYKNLNYEIETIMADHLRRRSMNYKNLNYEIETGCKFVMIVQTDW